MLDQKKVFEQQFTRHNRISDSLKKIEVSQKYTVDTFYDNFGLGFINQSRLFKLIQKGLRLKGLMLLACIIVFYILIYSMVSSSLSNALLIFYALLQSVYEIQRQKDTKKQLLIFWLIFSADILIENYVARDHFTLVRYIKLIIVHICFVNRLYVITLLLQLFNCLATGKNIYNPSMQSKSYFK